MRKENLKKKKFINYICGLKWKFRQFVGAEGYNYIIKCISLYPQISFTK